MTDVPASLSEVGETGNIHLCNSFRSWLHERRNRLESVLTFSHLGVTLDSFWGSFRREACLVGHSHSPENTRWRERGGGGGQCLCALMCRV
jgi:hypothetical protein